MYQIVGLKRLLVAYAVLAAAVAVGAMALRASAPAAWTLGWFDYLWAPISLGLSGAAGVLWAVGETPIFPKFCRLRVIRSFMPDLDGEWHGELRSNWPRIEARGNGASNVEGLPLLPCPSTVRIKARLLTVTMLLDTKDRYSESRTVLAGVARDPESGDCVLSYIYENRTKEPKPGDEPFHLGAAMLSIRCGAGDTTLEGPYWTNRAWTRGLNTAGMASFRRLR